MKGSTKVAQTALFVGAAGGYLAGITELLDKDSSVLIGIIWIAFGTVALFLAIVYLNMNIRERKKK